MPEILTEVLLATGLVVMVKVAVVVPGATVTLASAWAAAVLLLESVTTAPPTGAGPLNVTVPVEESPPTTDVGLRLTDVRVAAVTVKVVVRVTVLYSAEIVTEVLLATGLVVMVKVAVVAPAATVTLAGAWAAAVLLLETVTSAPPTGAGPLNVTVPVEDTPPSTDVGLRVTDVRVAAVTVRVVVRVTLLYSAEIVTEVLLATGLVVIVKVAVVAPAATVTLAGAWAAAELLLESVTTAPPTGAALLNVTVPVEDTPPSTDAGLTLTELSAATGAVTVKVAVLVTVL